MREAPAGRMPRLEKLAARYEFVTTFCTAAGQAYQ